MSKNSKENSSENSLINSTKETLEKTLENSSQKSLENTSENIDDFFMIILESPFYSIIEIAQKTYPFLPVKFMLKDRFDSFFQENDLERSLEYFQKALDLRLQTKNSKSISESYYNLGDYYFGLENYKEALKYYSKSEYYCKNIKLVKEELDAILAISEVYKTQNKWELAYQEMAKVVDLQKKYFSELAIEQSSDNELLQSLDQMEVDDKNVSHEAKLIAAIENEKYHTNILYAVFAFALIALTLLVFYRKKIS